MQLIAAGVSVQSLRTSIAALIQLLPEIKTPLTELSLVATGDVVLIFHQGAAFEALSGQEWILPIAQLQRNIEQQTSTARNEDRKQTDLFPEISVDDDPQHKNLKKAI